MKKQICTSKVSAIEAQLQIENIYDREQKTMFGQEYLEMAFFLISAIFAVLWFVNVKNGNAVALFGQYCVYAAAIVTGYLLHRYLVKHLNFLWEMKKAYIGMLNQ